MKPQINVAQYTSPEKLTTQLQDLMQKLEEVEEEKNSYETLVEIITQHSTDLENQMRDKNREMQTYIQQVKKVIDAAIAVKNNSFEPQILSDVAARTDALGELAQVFSHMVETVKAREQELEKLLQGYGRFIPDEQRISPEIRNHNGFIVKYIGDGVMAVFPEGVDDAIQAGIVMLEQLQKYNQSRQINGYIPLNIGIGIHVGDTMVGIIGDANRMQADALSDHVNLTARLESLTKYYGVSLLISGDVVERLSQPEKYHIRFLDRAIVKGRQEAITVCEVLDVELEPVRSLKIQTVPIFEEGLEQYSQGNFANAKVCFEQIVAISPADKPSQLYLERIQALLENSIPANWNGVWKFTQK
jgi:two-component system sensor histidine kinase ChiS